MLSSPPDIDNEIDGLTLNHNQVLFDLLQSDKPLPEVAAAHKLTLNQLLTWSAQAPIRALIASANELAHVRASHTAAQSRHLALTVLTEHCRALCETPRDRDLASRAARALLRAIEVGPPTSMRRPPSDNNPGPPIPRTPRPPQRPSDDHPLHNGSSNGRHYTNGHNNGHVNGHSPRITRNGNHRKPPPLFLRASA